MPGRLRQSSGRTSAITTEEGPYNISGLEFNEPLSWRAGKAIAVADLLERLQKLAAELRQLEQGQIPAKEFAKIALDLANANLLGHKDKGIRAWSLCCIVDILNICAPDAPFRPAQLKDIFTVVVNTILPALGDPTNAYNQQHVYILNSLVDTKSIVLITDLQDAETLIVPLFTICFDIVSGSSKNAGGVEVAKSVEFQLRSMLVTIVDEANLPQDVIDIIISQFLRVDPRTVQESGTKRKGTSAKDKTQGTLAMKDYPPAYHMAKAICTTCSDKMMGYISQYFGTIIMNATASLGQSSGFAKQFKKRTSDLSDSEDDDNESLSDLRKAHRLVRELWRACPDVLSNIVPQIEAELAADSAAIRQVATETLGDIIAGVGISGLPSIPNLDPSEYPLPSLENPPPQTTPTNPLLTPISPKPFAHVHNSAYQAFLGRRIDKSAQVRIAWAIAASHILMTDAGGIGLSSEEQRDMLSGFTQMLRDSDDKVRLSAIQSLGIFDYHSVVNVLGRDGGLSQPDSFLTTLAQRVTDKKHAVREEAMLALGCIWGVASRDIEQGVDRVVTVLGDIPSKLLAAMYTNDPHILVLLDRVLYESLIPISYPPVKTKTSGTQKQNANQRDGGSSAATAADADSIRVSRILTLVRSLDQRAKPVFFGIQKRQTELSRAITIFLKACEDYNGGVIDDPSQERQLEERLTKFIDSLSRQQPDQARASADLWKFAKAHDRRNYQLIRFATGAEHDYRTVSKAIKELTKRVKESSSGNQMMETLTPLLYRCALVVYNRSHVPAIMEATRSEDAGTAEAAHELLKEISAKNPEVLKSHIQALCKELEETAPSKGNSEATAAADSLKACAAFARKYPADVPKERKFLVALINFTLFADSPRAAKHAVTIALTVSDKKELHAKEILTKAIKTCQSSPTTHVAQLAAIAQVCLLAPRAASAEDDNILKLAMSDILHKNLSPSTKGDPSAWIDPPDGETVAKELALKALVNRCRSSDDKDSAEAFDKLATSVITLLMSVIEGDGEISPSKNTPATQRNRLRLTAARFILKLCCHKRRCEELVMPQMFTSIALIIINPPYYVRLGLVNQLKKYLGRNQLNARWYTILFLIAFEPDDELRNHTISWLKSRVSFFVRQQKQATSTGRKAQHQNVMEMTFARLLSMLAHHPDYPVSGTPEFDGEMLDFAKYIVFYLQAVASEDSLSLIFHIAQRVKQTQDAVTGSIEASERLYLLSDLAQATIRNYADVMPAHARGTNLLQTWPGKVHLPTALFKPLPGHTKAQEIADKNFLPEDVALGLEHLVRKMIKSTKTREGHGKAKSGMERKRRGSNLMNVEEDDDIDQKTPSTKKSKKSSALPIRKTPKATKRKGEAMSAEQPSRKSARMSTNTKSVNYMESDEDEEDEGGRIRSSPIARNQRSSRRETSQKLSIANEEADTVMEEDDDEKENTEQDGQIESVADSDGEALENEPETTPLKESRNSRTARSGKSKANAKETPKSAKSSGNKQVDSGPQKKKAGKAKNEPEPSSPPTRRTSRRTKG